MTSKADRHVAIAEEYTQVPVFSTEEHPRAAKLTDDGELVFKAIRMGKEDALSLAQWIVDLFSENVNEQN